MLLSKADNALLIIEQNGAASTSDNGNRLWNIHWKLYSRPEKLLHQKDVRLSEPLDPDDRSEIAEYLNQSLDDNDFDQTYADFTSQKIDDYRKSLFDELKIDNEYVGALRGMCLEIHIWPDRQPGLDRPSIHSIQWEQLEDNEIWDRHHSVQSVTVCRHVHPPKSKRTRSRKTTKSVRQDRNGTFDVLLVVARPHIHDAPERSRNGFNVLNPGTVRSVLLQLQEELNSMDSSRNIRLEIVRPGCMKELKAHLKKRKRDFNGKRPYHVIHFDMHGGHENGKKAFLEFNGYKDEDVTLGTEPKYAKDIAQLLRDHHIDCVILNACMSAVADANPSANLSSVFLRNGISAVLAMSYNMHDSISKRFYSKFYSEFFVYQAPISIAASKARKALSVDRTRWNYAKKGEVRVQDWFVPVVYTSSEEPYRFSNYCPLLSGALCGNIPGLDFFLALTVSVSIYLLISGTLCSLVKAEVGYCSKPSKSISTWHKWGSTATPLSWPLVRKIYRLCRYWRIRQRLRVLAEDRQNVLRIEGDLRRKRMIFLHSQEDVEEYASPFVDCLATIWERTHFVASGGVVDAEWFLQPWDLSHQDDWRLWMKAFTNLVYFWAYSLRRQHTSSTKEIESVVIIENLEALYPEQEELKEMQYYADAQRRLEYWLKEHFTARKQQAPPYLMLTALHGKELGHSVSEWLKSGPGKSGVLDPTVTTVFVKTSQRYVDPTNASYDKDKWYDWSVSWFCGDVSRPPKQGLISALWNFCSILIEIFVCMLYKAVP